MSLKVGPGCPPGPTVVPKAWPDLIGVRLGREAALQPTPAVPS